ncbi:2-oxoacid:ferredoxin oxidoreductase subunit beta [Thermoanaerobacterium thermosaccharolyticum]|uniref:2-oxoacid:acceptor oxidoreductase, beta subunit, pyruvate/2-ketoisovalerate family n=1 Tax=Thermoanaerobacterium thermosaccharolyticum M0795 TaxID=698948 RepID=L0IL13_THETR|nr:2-oxoacid:ferredoxin oxidoreductase subunit beta [Thermoanaerobacterium thermosaccharolyticum]AGB20210.1 2-oxoacid:acceptor oxidoreductase, beta subunit, pyruvate/2-ketoisovalerate family [Thermoanaerobacterium thermosaccharolyticum M0795]
MNTAFETYETAWCPGCGNFGILNALKDALTELGLKPHQVVIASGIGQAAKMPHYINVNGFNGLHGRALPPATAINIANKDLKVIINSGDGDTYGEGGNHFIHAIRRNANIAHFVHDNQIYGLTKGQASPTTAKGQKTSLQFDGIILDPIKPIKLALTMGAGFVARSFSGNYEHLKRMMKEAISYNGYALLDIFQPCVTFNKVNTFKWYNDRVYELPEDYDYTDINNAFKMADEWDDRIPIGIIYKVEKPTYIDNIKFLKDGPPLIDVPLDPLKAEKYMEDFK